jgi:hypothetical protein
LPPPERYGDTDFANDDFIALWKTDGNGMGRHDLQGSYFYGSCAFEFSDELWKGAPESPETMFGIYTFDSNKSPQQAHEGNHAPVNSASYPVDYLTPRPAAEALSAALHGKPWPKHNPQAQSGSAASLTIETPVRYPSCSGTEGDHIDSTRPAPEHSGAGRVLEAYEMASMLLPAPTEKTCSRRLLIHGIDVSDIQKVTVWQQVVQNGHQFAFTKATEGMGYREKTFADNWNRIKAAGMVRGA